MPSCQKSVCNLPRHLQGKEHGWSKEAALASVSQYLMRTPSNKGKTNIKPKGAVVGTNNTDYHTARICPVKNCMKVVQRLPNHLRHKHKMAVNEKYRMLLKNAVSYSPTKFVDRGERSPTKKIMSFKNSNVLSDNVVPSDTVVNDLNDDMVVDDLNDLDSNENIDLNIVAVELATNEKNVISQESIGLNSSEYDDPTFVPSAEEQVQIAKEFDLKFNPDMENIFRKFLFYLISPDGGNRHRESSEQTVNEVRRACIVMNATGFTKLFKRNVIREEYLINYCQKKGYLADSIKKYLISLISFCTFLIVDDINVLDTDKEDILKTKLILTNYKSSYNKKSRERFWERQEEDFQMLVTPDQVAQYMESENAHVAADVLKTIEHTHMNVNIKEYCAVRDHLFIFIHFGNGHRSGVSANMLISEFNAATEVDGSYQIRVKNHKNYAHFGPAITVLDPAQFNYLRLFVEKLRPQVNPINDNIMLSWSGRKMRSGAVSKQLHSLWSKAGIFDNKVITKKLSCNIVRKSTSTGLRETKTGNYQEVADLMTHSLDTAKKHYHIRSKQLSATTAGAVIGKYFGLRSESPTKIQEDKTPPRSPKHVWTPYETVLLESVFAEELKDRNCYVDIDIVRERLPQLCMITATEKQIVDKIRYLKRNIPTNARSLQYSSSKNSLLLPKTSSVSIYHYY